MKKFMGSVKDAGSSVATSAQKIVSKPTTKDEQFEELRTQFVAYKKAIEGIKSTCVKLQGQTKDYVKSYKDVSANVEEFFNLRKEEEGRKFASFTGQLESAAGSNFLGAIGEVIAGTETLININEGLKKRISHRDDLCLDMDMANKDKEKDEKKKLKFDESQQKYEETNDKLKKDLKDAMEEGHPKFREHYATLMAAQKRMFSAWNTAANELD